MICKQARGDAHSLAWRPQTSQTLAPSRWFPLTDTLWIGLPSKDLPVSVFGANKKEKSVFFQANTKEDPPSNHFNRHQITVPLFNLFDLVHHLLPGWEAEAEVILA